MIYRFSLAISYQEFARYYQGAARCLSVMDDLGQRLQLPADRFRVFLTPAGVHGRFHIRTENGRLTEIEKVA